MGLSRREVYSLVSNRKTETLFKSVCENTPVSLVQIVNGSEGHIAGGRRIARVWNFMGSVIGWRVVGSGSDVIVIVVWAKTVVDAVILRVVAIDLWDGRNDVCLDKSRL
jgi:hypothetical protein